MMEKWKSYFKGNFSKIILGASASLMVVLLLTVLSLRKEVVINIDGNKEVFVTYKGTVEEVLQASSITLDEKDKVDPALDEKVSDEDTITIIRAVEIQLTANDKVITIETAEETVEAMIRVEEEALKEEGIAFNEGVDEITPALETEIEEDMEITLVKVEEYNLVETESISFDVITEKDDTLDKSVEQVRQEGINGEKEITYTVIKKDGVEVSREAIEVEVTKEPVNEIIAQGTRQTFVSRSQEVLDYIELIYCESTAYSGGGITATGTVPRYNPDGLSTIAVDPRVIPLGSLVYVDGYGKAVAEDTGGAIKGNIVDVYLNSNEEALNKWGRKYNVAVYVLAYPGQW